MNDNGPRGLMGAAMSDGTDSSVRLLKYGRWQGKVRPYIGSMHSLDFCSVFREMVRRDTSIDVSLDTR